MNNLIRASSAVAVLLLAGLTVTPSASAAAAIGISPTSCGDPGDNWVYVCNEMHQHAQRVTLYRLAKPTPTTPVCPALDICVNVPQPLQMVESYSTYVYYNHPHPQVTPNTQQIVEDVCDILDPTCRSIGPATLSADLTFIGWLDDNMDGVPDGGVARTTGGDLVALELASSTVADVQEAIAPVAEVPAAFSGLSL